MADPKLIVQPPGSTPTDLDNSRGAGRPLPPDLLRDASRRLGIMALIGAGLWVIGSLLGHVAFRAVTPGDYGWLAMRETDLIAAMGVIFSLALFAYTRRTKREPAFVLDLGLVYLVLTACNLGLIFHWGTIPRSAQILPEISWIGAVVLMYAAVVPTTPAKMLLAGLIAVSMNPVGMLMARARGIVMSNPRKKSP